MQATALMAQIQDNWPAVAGVVLLLLALAIWLLTRRKAPRMRRESTDVLSDGAARANRNTALIDAPPAASFTPTTFASPGGIVAETSNTVTDEPVTATSAEPLRPRPPEASPDAGPDTGPGVGLYPTPTDDLSRIKGLGPKLRARLADLGVTRFAQIAAWSEADLVAIDAQLGSFAGRPAKDNWTEQARMLANGDLAAYEGTFGKV